MRKHTDLPRRKCDFPKTSFGCMKVLTIVQYFASVLIANFGFKGPGNPYSSCSWPLLVAHAGALTMMKVLGHALLLRGLPF